MTTTPRPERKRDYDEDLLVELLAHGRLSFRKIADMVGISYGMVSAIAHGRKRRDLHDRVSLAVADDQRRAKRLRSSSSWAIMKAHIKEGLEGTGESARLSREFILRLAYNDPDPAGRFIGRVDRRGHHITDAEQDLLDAVRGDPRAAAFADLPKRMRRRLQTLVRAGGQ